MPEQPPTLFRRGRLPRTGAAVAVLLALVAYVAVQYVFGGKADPRCKVVSGNGDGASYTFGADQAENAATVTAVGTARGMPERAITIALATALQESGLRNIRHGDRDSLGLFQQRPTQGWGNARQIMDPAYSAARFYAHLEDVPGYSRLPLTVAAQRVQRSGFPQAYAKHEPDAALLAAALTGRSPATLTCEGRTADEPGDPAKVRAALIRDFGRDVAPVSGPGGTVTVPVDAAAGGTEGGAGQRGWELAHWAVARAFALGIERVSYGGREWSTADAGKEWRKQGKAGEKSAGGQRAGAGNGTDQVRIVVGH
ncbi:heavy metal transporter [Streptomyces sp. NPDC059900]|uniref:heavy metal transporter n=1 Tax=Streptomyces sp. NPDC059900 TaxID=3155816 RepID=UPI003416397B